MLSFVLGTVELKRNINHHGLETNELLLQRKEASHMNLMNKPSFI